MKKGIFNGLMGCVLALCPLQMKAVTEFVVSRGEGIQLQTALEASSYQWQISTDEKFFYDLPEGNARNVVLKAFGSAYYRVKTTGDDGGICYADTIVVKMTPVEYANGYSLSSGGHGYVETLEGEPSYGGISIPVENRKNGLPETNNKLSDWTDMSKMAVYYIHHPKAIVDTKMYIRVKKNKNVAFRISVYQTSDLNRVNPVAEHYLAFTGTGTEQVIDLIDLSLPNKDYYRYQIECLEGCKNIVEISKYQHYSPASSIETYRSAYLSSPSVHLGSWRSTDKTAPVGKHYDWCYQEVMLPKESDVIGTYVMSLGVLQGYMGIQVNGWNGDSPEHNVIFSMWDDGDTDKDPNLPKNLRADVVDYGEGVMTERFANEGTGMKSFKRGNNWNCDTYVQFLTNCRPEDVSYTTMVNGKETTRLQHNTLVSTWYNAQDGKGWQYMATLRLPNKTLYFESWYSFIENYNWSTGQAIRKGYYRNGYARTRDGKKWYHFNKVNFSHTGGEGTPGSRADWEQGASPENDGSFYMATGGYLPTVMKSNEVPLRSDHTPVDTIQLDKLLQRVDLAIQNQDARIEAEKNFEKKKLDKKGWRVIKRSSEEVSGEGENGRAYQLIDNNVNTYWQSKWTGGMARYPHEFVIDMRKRHELSMGRITMNGGIHRNIKSFDFYVSTNNKDWTKVYSNADVPEVKIFKFVLDQPVEARFLKFVITDGRATDGDYVHIDELDFLPVLVPDIVGDVRSHDSLFNLCYKGNDIEIVAPETTEQLQVSVIRTDGVTVFAQDYNLSNLKEAILIPLSEFPQGTFIVHCQSEKSKYSCHVTTF